MSFWDFFIEKNELRERRSYGVIPLRKTGEEVEVLIIKQKHPHAPYWTLAKGTPHIGEPPLSTAMRETKEEVGIVCDRIDPHPFIDHYTFAEGGYQYDKSVTYFIGRAQSYDAVLQEEEVAEYEWLSLSAAKEKLTYKGTKQIVDEIEAYLPHSRLFETKSL